MYAVAVKVSRRPVATTIAAGTATALVPSYVIWTTSGLENGLFACVVTVLAAILARAAAANTMDNCAHRHLDRRVGRVGV